jgi:hypothetical protein
MARMQKRPRPGKAETNTFSRVGKRKDPHALVTWILSNEESVDCDSVEAQFEAERAKRSVRVEFEQEDTASDAFDDDEDEIDETSSAASVIEIVPTDWDHGSSDDETFARHQVDLKIPKSIRSNKCILTPIMTRQMALREEEFVEE